jgi:protein O-GlcNAc transferase
MNAKIQEAFDAAVEHHQAGRLTEAQEVYRQVLAEQPKHVEALHLLGVLAGQCARFDIAIDFIRRAIALQPIFPDAYYHLGLALSNSRQREQAIIAWRKAIDQQPDLGLAHVNLGTALKGLGQLDEAIAAYRRAITYMPDYPEAYYNLGIALHDARRFDEAASAYRQAVALRPQYVEALSNLGNALAHMEQYDEAISNFESAISLQSDHTESHFHLARSLKATGQLNAAIAAFRRAVELRPSSHQAHSNIVFSVLYQFGIDREAIAHEHRIWNKQHAEPLKTSISTHPNNRDPNRRLRVGYVSADFFGHASALFLVPLLQHHDRQEVELFCYAQVPRADDITRRMQGYVPKWRSTVDLSDEQVATQVREDQIDILVDLKLHTAQHRLLVFARKPAPVQVTWLGYPGSTGLSTIDYRLSDPYIDPPGMDEGIYSEQTIRLPDCYWCYDPFGDRDMPVTTLPSLKNGFVTFTCLNTFCKINDAVLRLWAAILRKSPSSRLILLAPEGCAGRRTANLLEKEGIFRERIEFVSRQQRRQYLETYSRADIALDTFPYNGHTTSLDSFWMGVPVVTLAGQTSVGRAGVSLLMNLNLPELIAETPEQYVQIAADLGSDLRRLEHLRSTLRERMKVSPLMDAPRFARNIEFAYRRVWNTWCKQ